MSTAEETKDTTGILRQAGCLERFHITRSAISFYNNVLVSASYSSPTPLTKEILIRALHTVLAAHPALSVGIRLPSSKTENPAFIPLPSIDFANSSKFIIWESSSSSPSHEKEYKDFLLKLHNTPFHNDDVDKLPLWRVAVLKRSYNTPTAHDSETNADGRIDYEIAFVFHHAIADGMSGAAFHYSLINALNSVDNDGVEAGDKKWDVYTPPKDLEMLPAMDEVLDFGMGLKTAGKVAGFLGKSVLPSFMQKTFWGGADKVPAEISPSNIEFLVLEGSSLEKLTKAVKEKKVSMTSFIAYAAAEALFVAMNGADKEEYEKMKYLKVSLPMSYKKLAGWDHGTIANCIGVINWEIPRFGKLEGEVSGMKKLTAELRKESQVTRDSEVGLLALVGDVEGFFKGQIGKPRDLAFEVSNLGVWDKEKLGEGKWRIEKAFFSQGASVAGPAFSINVATVGGRMGIVVQWMQGVMNNDVMAAVVKNLEINLTGFAGKVGSK